MGYEPKEWGVNKEKQIHKFPSKFWKFWAIYLETPLNGKKIYKIQVNISFKTDVHIF